MTQKYMLHNVDSEHRKNVDSEHCKFTMDDRHYIAESLEMMVELILNRKVSSYKLKQGVEISFRRDELGWGISLSLHPCAQSPHLLESALKRRFIDAEHHDGYFLCIDDHRNFVVWYELKRSEFKGANINRIISRLLGLVGFGLS